MFVLKYRKRNSNFYKTFPREIQLFRFHRGRLAWRGCWARPRWGSGPWLSSRRAAPWRRSLHFRPFKQEKYFLCKKLKSRTNKQTRRWQRSYLSKLLKGRDSVTLTRNKRHQCDSLTVVWWYLVKLIKCFSELCGLYLIKVLHDNTAVVCWTPDSWIFPTELRNTSRQYVVAVTLPHTPPPPSPPLPDRFFPVFFLTLPL